jgi:hypothetical protein
MPTVLKDKFASLLRFFCFRGKLYDIGSTI